MASSHIYIVSNTADQTTAAATAKTFIQLVTPATRKCWVTEFGISFKSVTATDVPGLVVFARQSTAGTATGVTPQPTIEGQPAALCSAQELVTVEPTTGVTVGGPWEVTPIGGLLVYQFPQGQEIELAVSSKLGLIITTPQIQNGRAYIKFNE